MPDLITLADVFLDLESYFAVTFLLVTPALPITEYCLLTVKDILYVFQGSEFSNAFPSVTHHVADDLWLNGVTPLVHF